MELDLRLRRILEEYRAGLSSLLSEDLYCVVLYGSHARGDAVEGSDIDLLCVMRGQLDYGALIERTSELTARLSLEGDVVISRAFTTLEEYESGRSPFIMNTRKEGTIV